MSSRLICLQCRSVNLVTNSQSLDCSTCGKSYPIVEGVGRFVAMDNYADSFGFQWNLFAKTQLDSFANVSVSHDRVFGVTNWPQNLSGQTILEAGSGAGRFTEILVKTGAEVISFDLSSAVDANQKNNGHNKNLTLLQASILDIPVERASMDKVFCLGVIQHTPDPAESFKSLAACVKPGGELVIDCYAKRITSVLSWKYVLRPLTKRLSNKTLYPIVESVTRFLFPLSNALYGIFGQWGVRLLPIVIYPKLQLSPDLHEQWAILDTFDMYSPAHDHPQSADTIRRWYQDAGFVEVYVGPGPNGYIARGKRPMANVQESAGI